MEPLGTFWNYLERPPGFWNARRAILYCLLAGDIISVLSSGTREAQMERPLANGTLFSATGTPHSYYTCTCVRW